MRMNKIFLTAASFLGLLLLILDSKTALIGANEGISLVWTVLVPSIFPFLFLSIYLSGSAYGSRLTLCEPLTRFLHLPEGREYLLIPAFLGGYPAGAQAVSQVWYSGMLSRENAEKMLSFCNNAGPSFLFGMVSSCFMDTKKIWLLWIIHILGAITAARLHPCRYEKTCTYAKKSAISASSALKQSISVMAVISSWAILFRVVIAFADRWFLWLLPPSVRTVLIGLLELSNGICELHTITDEKIRFLICSGLLCVGGACVTMQTYSVTEGLGKSYYFSGKITQLLVCLCCSAACMYHVSFLLPLLFLPMISRIKNKGRNLETVCV